MDIGQIFAGRFVLEELAGRGGMAEVYRALDQSTGQTVAVKILHGEKGNSTARFEREAHILAQLDHPLIVRHVAHGSLPSGELYLAMEWLEGEDLAARLARGPLDARDSMTLALRIAEALAVLHERGFVHRDLKPGNVFLVNGRVDQIKLLDFGLVLVEQAARMTGSGMLLGTVAYMAPEQARGEQRVDARVDIFALGCVLLECLTAEPAYSASHAMAILTKLLFEEAPRLRSRLPGAPAELDALVAHMLAKSPDRRPRDGRAAAEALRALVDMHISNKGTASRINHWHFAETVEQPRSALTGSEQRAVAVILLGAPAAGTVLEPGSEERLASDAVAHGGIFERLVDGSAAVLLSGMQVATDLAAQAARCALALAQHARGRRIALALERSESVERLLVGPAIDQAARLLGSPLVPVPEAQQALITLDDSTVGLLDARFEVRARGGMHVLVGERDMAEARTLLGKPTPCVGRERELRQLQQLIDDCVEDSAAQAVVVIAPPGVGKSRLLHELMRRVQETYESLAVWIARGDSLRAGSAFGLLGQALRSACGVRESEPLEARRHKLRAYVAERVAQSEQQRVTEFLGEIIGTPFTDEHNLPLQVARADAQLMSDQMRAAFLDFVAAECARNPVLIVLEDLHWGDRPTVQFIDHALRDLGDLPLLVLALARPEVHDLFPRLWAERRSQELRLKELSRKAIEQLVRHVLGEQATPASIDKLAQLSEGNAFYLEELIRWAAEERGDELPQTVVAMVQSRLAALDDESRRLLRAASVFGEVFWPGGVAMLLGGVERMPAMREPLARLVEQELLVRRKHSRFSDQDEYAFRHALLREGAYAMLTDQDLMLGHQLAGEWLEASGEPDARLLAEHFEKGGERERAGRHYLRAVAQTHAAGDPTAALTYGQRGLACAISSELRIEILGRMCETSAFQLELITAAQPYAQELVQVAPRGSAPWIRGMFIAMLCAWHAGEPDEFLALLVELLEIELSATTASSLGLAFVIGGQILDQLRLPQSDALIEHIALRVRELSERVPLASSYWHASVGVRHENPASGLMHSAKGTAIAEVMGHRSYIAGGLVFQGMNLWLLGAAAEARRILWHIPVPDEWLALSSSIRPFVLAWLLAEQSDMDEARAWATRLLAFGKERGVSLDQGRGHWALAEVLRRAGELDAADAEIQAALAILGKVSPLDVPGALATLAALRLAQGRHAEALAAAEDGLARYQSMGACSRFFRGAFLRLVHIECLEATGQHQAARAALGMAWRKLLAHADKIPDAAHRHGFLHNVPENRQILELAQRWLGAHSVL